MAPLNELPMLCDSDSLAARVMFQSSLTDPRENTDLLKRWRCGRIIMKAGKLQQIRRRWLPSTVSVAQVLWQMTYGRMDDDICWLDYHQPIGMPGFLTLDYVRSGHKAGYKSFAGAVHVLDEIARARNAVAIVAHVTNGGISDRFMQRMGWQQHLQQWSGRHWIRRFYDGYPEPAIERYLT